MNEPADTPATIRQFTVSIGEPPGIPFADLRVNFSAIEFNKLHPEYVREVLDTLTENVMTFMKDHPHDY